MQEAILGQGGHHFRGFRLGLDKWMMAIWMITSCKNGVSSYEIARSIGVTQKSAWHMMHRIREAMQSKTFTKIGGSPKNPVEIDETYVGGKKRTCTRTPDCLPAGRQEGDCDGHENRDTRESERWLFPMRSARLCRIKFSATSAGAHIYTDEHVGYQGVDATHLFVHKTVNHMNEYVRGEVHTNGIENFWSLLKRTLKGTYVAVEPFHLDRYLAEQVFRFNNCGKKMNDLARFEKVLGNVAGAVLPMPNSSCW